MKLLKSAFLVFLFILSSFLTCSKNNLDPTELEPIDLSEININNLPYKFKINKLLVNHKDVKFYPCDLDNDGKDEILHISNVRGSPSEPSFITLLTIDPQRPINQTNFDGFLQSYPTIFDLDNDGENEIIISESVKDSTYVSVLDSEGEKLHRFVAATNPYKNDDVWSCCAEVEAFIDINSDGYPEILFIIHTDYAYQPRGILAYDYKNKKILWEYKTGFVPVMIRLMDISSDGRREILFGSAAPCNGVGIDVNGTDDSKVYLTVIDSLGNYLKSQQIGKKSTARLYINDLNGDNKKEIIVHYICQQDTTENSFVALWDPNTKHLKPNISLYKNLSCEIFFLDSDNDGKDDIFIAWEDGQIEFRNHKFEKIVSKYFPNFYPQNVVLEDFNNDGEKEIIVSGYFDGKAVAILLNRQLKILAYFNRDFYVSKIIRTGFGKEKQLIGKATKGDRKVLIELKRHYKVLSLEFWKQFGMGLIFGILLTATVIRLYSSSKYREKLSNSLKSIIDSLSEGIAIFDNSGNFVIINDSLKKIFQLEKNNIIGLHYQEVFSKDDLFELNNIIKPSYEGNSSFLNKEINFKQNGNALNLIIEIGNIKLVDYKKPFKLLVVRDITSSVLSTRTIAWATMAQKLAHEIKTPLSTVLLSAQRLELGFKNDTELDKKFGKYLSKITRQVDRLRQLTDSFMKFAKSEKPKVEKLNLNNLISKAINDLQIIIGTNVEIKKEFTKDIPSIRIDGQQILIAIKNIVNNSLKAMGGTGILTITTRLVQSLLKQVGQNNIQIEITDTGTGISKQDMGQLFQPFFSKSPSGTGLGLVIVKKIIEDHNGSIKIDSEEGIGTTVVISLPCID